MLKYSLFLFYLVSFAQQTQKVDFLSLNATLVPNVLEKSISGNVKYDFFIKNVADTIKIDAIKMNFKSVKINNNEVKFINSGKQLLLFEGFKTGKNTLTFQYKAIPKQTLYFIGENENLQIWTQGQGKYTSHWLPSFDDVNEKLIFNLTINFDKNYQVISNGKLAKITTTANTNSWNFEMQKPMSSYLVMMAIGKYESKNFRSKSNIPINLYLNPNDIAKFESTYKYSIPIFDFFEQEIGIKYPWQIYNQIPVNDFLYAGMENTTATIFSQNFVVDEIGFNDKNYINVNAHELAHQWFGNLVTATSGKDHWLQEGFATYYALLAEKHLFGDDHFNFEMLEMATELDAASQTDTIPILNEKASSLTFYKKGAWALHVIRENIGEENFQKAVKNYLKKYQFQNVTTNNFLDEIRKVSNYDVDNFKQIWLEKSGFETQTAIEILSKNQSVKQLFDFEKKNKIPFQEKKNTFEKILKSDAHHLIKAEVITKLKKEDFNTIKEFLIIAMEKNNIKVRQEIAQFFYTIPLDFKSEYESLLYDKSYTTQEIALQNLCRNFPLDIKKYLEIAKNWVGFNNKNLRITWLKIALENPDFETTNQTNFKNELIDYCAPNYDSSIRQNALEVLIVTNPENEKVLQSLVNATIHHKWQFVKFGKDAIRTLMKQENYRKLFQDLLHKISEKEKSNLEKLLKEKS